MAEQIISIFPSDAVRKAKFFVFDSETSGLDPGNDRIIELAVVEYTPAQSSLQTEPFSVLINPARTLTAFNMSIHRINNEMLKNEPMFREAWDRFTSHIAACCKENERPVLVAHNAIFDVKFLQNELKRTRQIFPDWGVACSLNIVQKHCPELPGKLRDLGQKFGVPYVMQHRAVGDVKALCQVLDGINGITVQKGQTVHELLLEDMKDFADYGSKSAKEIKRRKKPPPKRKASSSGLEWDDDVTSTPETSPRLKTL